MNTITTNNYQPLSKDELKQLCADVKEMPVAKDQLKKFTTAEMWKIHKVRRSASLRRY